MNLVYLANGDVIINNRNRILEPMTDIQSDGITSTTDPGENTTATMSPDELNASRDAFNTKQMEINTTSANLENSKKEQNLALTGWNNAKASLKIVKDRLDASIDDLDKKTSASNSAKKVLEGATKAYNDFKKQFNIP